MPSKTKLKNAAIAVKSAALPKTPQELIDQFVTGAMTGGCRSRRAAKDWKEAMNQFAILYEDRFTKPAA